ncbi:MAG TPA: N-acetylmuramoyl-L-alanine amidase [Gemmatimonadaceae bacterium]|nr:N-acetylmuramoyl-L-alanine amidase [Gemmatimonadaceae bacterium]
MLIELLLGLQLRAAVTGGTLTVRTPTATERVPLVADSTGPLLRPEMLAPLLPVTVTSQPGGHYRVVIAGTTFDLEVGVPSAVVGDQVRPLATAPQLRERHLFVPLQLVSELLPSVTPNLRWDAAANQLVIFTRMAASKPKARLVVVDAGHGGPDDGMKGPIGRPISIYEKDVTLAVALKLGAELRARGLRVVYTRTTDTLIALSDRGKIANQAGGDIFISVHVNAANLGWKDPAAARGFETYFLAEAKTEDARRVEQMENESVRFETGTSVSKDDALSYILSDMKQNEHLRESSELAELVQEHLGTMHPGPSRGVKQAGFRVLVTAFMPAVLVEIGFGTNAAEAAYLTDRRRQSAIAGAIADAAVEYLRNYERRVNGGAGRDER